ncbi:MAG: XcyI family restriction endonuclease [Ktedonobacterales bacterium]
MSSLGWDEWYRDQLAKSEFFHARLHDWHLLETAREIEAVKGEDLSWNLSELGISDGAWAKVIHRGIRPVRLFAHPAVLVSIARSPGYYRMLSMVSQKSMGHVKVASGEFAAYEIGTKSLSTAQAAIVAKHLNGIISLLVEADKFVDERELDIWRGMAAGTQAQGSWQNIKGQKAEAAIKDMLRLRMRERGLIARETATNPPLAMRIELSDGRTVIYGSEPDIAVYAPQDPTRSGGIIAGVLEVKGGIDTAAVHERHGATLKSLVRAKEVNGNCVTVLILPRVSLTASVRDELAASHDIVNHWFTTDDVLGDEKARERLFRLLDL